MKINPAFQALIPPLAPEELAQLEANIVADGCRDPLVTWRGMLLDGHNRYAICTRRNIPFETQGMVSLPDEDAAKVWIIDNQKGRRNVSEIDRIALAAAREEIIARKAKEKQRQHGGTAPGKPQDTSGKIAKSDPVNTRAESAKAAGVGERTYDAGKLILKAAAEGVIRPEVVEDVRRGRAAIHRVAKDIKERLQREDRQEKRVAAASSSEIHSQIIVGDFREHAHRVADGSLSLIFTDPPYDREASKLFAGLGKFAADKLSEGGSLVCYIGHIQIQEAMSALSAHLRLWWVCACVHGGPYALMREYGIRVGWKPMLWFVKGTRHDKSKIILDTVTGPLEKQHHDWQQSECEAAHWIDGLTTPDGIVCDPFIGGGTTAAAAKALGRKWVGFEIDPSAAAIASSRLSA